MELTGFQVQMRMEKRMRGAPTEEQIKMLLEVQPELATELWDMGMDGYGIYEEMYQVAQYLVWEFDVHLPLKTLQFLWHPVWFRGKPYPNNKKLYERGVAK